MHDTEALGGACRNVQELATWLAARGVGVVRLQLTLTHERHLRQRGLPATVVPFALGAPARMPAHLLGVLRERLARVALPAPVEAILLASEETAPLAGRNLGLLPGDEAAAVEVPLIDRLRARLGEDAVVRLTPAPNIGRSRLRAMPGGRRPRQGALKREIRPGRQITPSGIAGLSPEAPRPLWLLAEP